MKKRILLVWLGLIALLVVPAMGEIVAVTPQDDYIHRYTAPNGQEIYYISREDEWAIVNQEDVNFDGHDDLVFMITRGASNGFFEFYVWDEGQYVLAGRNEFLEFGLGNYSLDPENGYVISHYSNGWAGLLHEEHIFRWKGNNLELVRYAVSENHKTSVFEGDVYVTIENNDLVHVRVFECRYGGDNREDEVIFERIVSMKEGFDEQALLEEEDAALWNGLK